MGKFPRKAEGTWYKCPCCSELINIDDEIEEEGLCDAEGEALSELDGDSDVLALSLTLGEEDTEDESEGLSLELGLWLAEGLLLGEGLSLADGLALILGLRLGLGELLGD